MTFNRGCTGYLHTLSNSVGDSYLVKIYGYEHNGHFQTCTGHGGTYNFHTSRITLQEIAL